MYTVYTVLCLTLNDTRLKREKSSVNKQEQTLFKDLRNRQNYKIL